MGTSNEAADDGSRPEALEQQVRRCIEAGDATGGLALWLRTMGPRVLGFLSVLMKSEPDAEEAFAVTCERLWRSLPSFRWECSLETWTYVIARREAARLRRGARRHDQGRITSSALDRVVQNITSQSRRGAYSERMKVLERLREELREDDRVILLLRLDRGLAWDEIALLFLSEAAGRSLDERRREAARVRKRFQTIKDRLAARVRAEGLL